MKTLPAVENVAVPVTLIRSLALTGVTRSKRTALVLPVVFAPPLVPSRLDIVIVPTEPSVVVEPGKSVLREQPRTTVPQR